MLMAEALGRVLREAGMHVVGCYGTLSSLLDKVRRCHPAVVIADAGLADQPGGPAALLWQLREAGPTTSSSSSPPTSTVRSPARSCSTASRR